MDKTLDKRVIDRRKKCDDIIRFLVNGFPKCFAYEKNKKKPLKSGVDLDIIAWIYEKLPDLMLSRRLIRSALRRYTQDGFYLKMLAGSVDKPRYDLQGKPSGTVTATEAQYAKNALKEKHKKLVA